MSSKHLGDGDRANYPKVQFKEIHIGEDAVALIVSKDVWDGGVTAVTQDQIKGIYEGRIKNWKELGGRDRRMASFNKEPGRGTWEVFAHWLYGNTKKAPQASFPEVGGNEETRNKVASTHGALSQLSSSWADGKKVFALGLKQDDGIIGPSGAGKSTLLRCLNRMVDFTTGLRVESDVLFHGASIRQPGTDVDALRSRIGMLLQQPVVFPKSIYENVIFGVRHLGQVTKAD